MNLKIFDIIILRGCLPLFLFSSAICRYSCFSFTYLVMLLICPFVKYDIETRQIGCAIGYLTALCSVSGIFCLSVITANVVFLYYPGLVMNCTVQHSGMNLVHQIGLIRLEGISYNRVFRLVFPDYLVLSIAIGLLVHFRRRLASCKEELRKEHECADHSERNSKDLEEDISNDQVPKDQSAESQVPVENSPTLCIRHNYLQKTLGIEMKRKKWRIWAMRNMFVFLNVVLVGVAGIASPSILNSIYLIIFLGVCTCWASGRKIIPKHFAFVRTFLVIYSALHVCLIYAVQLEWAQHYLPNGTLLSRLLGAYYIIDSSCQGKGEFLINPQRWIDYFSPIVVMGVYYFSATEARRWALIMKSRSEKLFSFKSSFGNPILMNRRSLDQMELLVESPHHIRNNSCHSCLSEDKELEGKEPQHETSVFEINNIQERQERPLLLSIIDIVIRNSYVFTFITMMAWSAIYKSWMSFILLLSACYLWMTPNSRYVCLNSSPLIVFYATVLIIIQYIYGFNLPELPVETVTSTGYRIDLSEIGLQKWDIPTGPLAVMISFLVIFWLTLRLFATDESMHAQDSRRSSKTSQKHVKDSNTFFGDVDNMMFRKIISFLNGACKKYWIVVCCFSMLFVSIKGPVVLFRIVYMVLLVYFLALFMLFYSFWRRQMLYFWWFVIIYSVMVILGIYTFQFKQVPHLWQNYTGISKEFLDDIGLRSYKPSLLFQGLLTPVMFLVILILQLRYFHKPFLKLSPINRIPSRRSSKIQGQQQSALQNGANKYHSVSVLSDESKFIDDINSLFQNVLRRLKVLIRIIKTNIWRFLECHSTKAVALIVMYTCIHEVNALNIIAVVIVVIGFPIPKLHYTFVTASFLYSSMVVLLKMIFQLKTVHRLDWHTNCSRENHQSNVDLNLSFGKISSAKWIGLESNEHFHISIINWAGVLVVCALWHVIKYHQMQFYLHPRTKTPLRGIIFPEVTLDSPKDSLITLFKTLSNFFFYHLGLEMCFIITIVVSCLRVDVYSIIYLVLLFIILFAKKQTYSKLWLPYMIFLGSLIPIQYAICVGIPPFLCTALPMNALKLTLKQWLYLPNLNNSPVSGKLMADFFQFGCVALQYQVFKLKESKFYHSHEETSGKPSEILNKDFMTTKHSYVDYMKHAIFYWWYWITLSVIFTTGVYWITLFCLGYMIIAFIYLWIGQDILAQNAKNIISSWNIIILYNFLVILCKCCLQLVGCAYIGEISSKGLCWMIPLLGIQCINPLSWNIVNVTVTTVTEDCSSVPNGLHWDVVCFVFVIFQRRILKTNLFRFVTLDINILNKFASRGAFWIDMRIMENIQVQRMKEKQELSRIERKIDKIIKLQAQHGKPKLTEHYLVLRSGDYYLFDGDPVEEDQDEDNNEGNDEDIEQNISDKSDAVGDSDILEFPIPKSRRSSMHSRKALKIYGDSQYHLLTTIPETKKMRDSKGCLVDCVDHVSCQHSEIDDDQWDEENSEESEDYQKIINPLKLISKAIEHGPRAVVRRYRQSFSESREHLSETRLSNNSYQTDIERITNTVQGDPNLDKLKSDLESALMSNHVLHSDIESPKDLSSLQNSPIYSQYDMRSDSHPSNDGDSICECICEESETENVMSESSGNCWNSLKFNVLLVFILIDSAVSFLIKWLDSLNADYYTASKKLDSEKRIVKKIVLSKLSEDINTELNISDELLNASRNAFEKSENRNEILKEKEFQNSRSKFFSLLIAICNVVNIHSEFICYVILISNHMVSGNVMSLPYPLMVFLWAMLSVPRPSKAFWISLITYTEIVIVIKYIFQFKIITFNILPITHRIDPLWYPLIIGIEKAKNYALFDVIQLLFIFLHRDYLKRNGLWRDHSEFCNDIHPPDEKETEKSNKSCGVRFRKIFLLIRKMKHFYSKMTNPKLNKKVDVYTFMFLFEFLSFWTIILGYFSFGPGTDSGDNAIIFIKTNKIPVPFICMIITQFLFFIIDRGLFLRRNVKGKFIFQVFHVLLIHAWLFFVLPHVTKKQFDSHVAPKFLYIFKCVYFALSAYQMKSGYPLRILGNFLTKKYNYVNLILFKGYRAIPFLYELRNVMDWMWTDTSVSFYHWMEVEDVFCKIFVLKCWRRSELCYPTDRGNKRKLAVRYTMGGLLLFFLVVCFWGPLAISSFIGTTFMKNRPIECSFSINVGGYSPFFVFNSRENNLMQLDAEIFRKMKECYHSYSTASDYLQSFEVGDVTEMLIDGPSDDAWLITPPGLEKLKEKLGSGNDSLKINIQVICERQMTEVKFAQKIVHYTHSRNLTENEKSALLSAMGNDSNNQSFVYLPDVFPRFLTAYKRKLSMADPLHRHLNNTFLNLGFVMKLARSIMWWEINEKVVGKTYCSENTIPKNHPYITVYIFNERISDSFFGTIFSNYGIIGIYAAYFFVVHRVLRSFYANISYIIPFEELPNVDRIMKLLNDIYLVRGNKMFSLEEELIAKLIFLYRSSQTMIEWTRQKPSVLETHSVIPRVEENGDADTLGSGSNLDD